MITQCDNCKHITEVICFRWNFQAEEGYFELCEDCAKIFQKDGYTLIEDDKTQLNSKGGVQNE